jgi:hypothetical protein
MAVEIKFDHGYRSFKTYASEETMNRAIKKLNIPDTVRYLVLRTEEGRLYPVFLGEKAIQNMVHFHFAVAN